MRHYLLLCMVTSAIAMQQPPVVDEFYQALREGNVEKVKAYILNPQVQNAIKNHQMYANESVMKFPDYYPQLKSNYLEIARVLVNNGALIADRALAVLKKYEESQKTIAPQAPTPKARLLPVTPGATPAVKPAPAASKPVTKPTPAPVSAPAQKPAAITPAPIAKPSPTIKPSATSKSPVDFVELQKLATTPDTENQSYKRLQNYLENHDLTALTSGQKTQIIDQLITGLYHSPQDRADTGAAFPHKLQSARNHIKVLLNNGFTPSAVSQGYLESIRQGIFGPRGQGKVSGLIRAIKNKNLPEVKRLVEQEGYDVNETDSESALRSPLAVAAEANAKDIALYLVSKGATLFNTALSQSFRPKLHEWGIPGY